MRLIIETGLSEGSQAYCDFLFSNTLAALGIVGSTIGCHFIVENVSPMDAAIIQATYSRIYGCQLSNGCFVSAQLMPTSPNWENDTISFLCRN